MQKSFIKIITKPSDNAFSDKISKGYVPNIQRSILKTMKTLLKLFLAVAAILVVERSSRSNNFGAKRTCH